MIKPPPSQVKAWIKQNFGSDFKTAKGGKEIRINNPLSIDSGYHLWINLHKSVVNDFRPNYKNDVAGSFISFVMKYKGIGFKEAVKEVMGDIDISSYLSKSTKIDLPEYESIKINQIELPNGFKKLTYDDNLISSTIKKYLNKRCVSNGKMYVLGIGHCGTDVVFPYYEFGKVVYWQQRSITNKRFLFPSESNKSNFIYGIDHIDPTDPVIITESIFNSLMFDNAIAIGGSDISNSQKNKLRKYGIKKIIMALDNDAAGIIGTQKAYDLLSPYFDLYYSFTNDESDWNDVAIENGLDEVMVIFKNNIKNLDYKASIKLKVGNKL